MTGGAVTSLQFFRMRPVASLFSHNREIGRGVSTMQNQARAAELRGRPVVGSRMIGDARSTNCGAVGARCPAVGGDHQMEPS